MKQTRTFAREFCNTANSNARASTASVERFVLHETFAPCQPLCLQASRRRCKTYPLRDCPGGGLSGDQYAARMRFVIAIQIS